MRAVTLRGLFTRKLRTVLTMIAIVLGVSMVSGTYVLTDTINQSFSDIFQSADRTLDAVISGKQRVKSEFTQPPTLPASLLPVVLHTPGVLTAEGEIADTVRLFNARGKSVGASGGAPALMFSVPISHFEVLTYVKGHRPSGDEISLDEGTVNHSHLHLGQRIGVASVRPLQWFTLAGVTHFGGVSSLGGATLVSMDLQHAQTITDKLGRYDQIAVAAQPGISQTELVTRLRAHIPPALRTTTQVKSGVQNASDASKEISGALNFLTIALLAFGGIALFVGAFIIFNTFSITVAQRMREFAMLRTLGATRGQVLRSVVAEALVVGVLASLIGLFAGLGIASGLNAIFKAFGIDLPSTSLVLQTRTVVVALLVGTIVTLVAGIWPAIRATRIPPIAALREGAELPRGRFARFMPIIAWLLTALGIALLALGLFAGIPTTTDRLTLIGVGAVVVFVGVAMVSPRLVRPLAWAIGWPIERGTNITGRLARENTIRNPSRTAVTAAALMIGLALVGFVTIFAAELEKTANDAVSREVAGDLIISDSTQTLLPRGVAGFVRRTPGVALVSSVNAGDGQVNSYGRETVNGVDKASFSKVYRFQWKSGSESTLSSLSDNSAVISDTFASDHHLTVGSALHVVPALGNRATFSVAGIFKHTQLLAPIVVTHSALTRDWRQQRDQVVLINAAPGIKVDALKNRITNQLKFTYPSASVSSQQDIKNQQTTGINQLLALIYVLLAMSVIVSLFGIVNTLVLSIYERTREIGMLRAIGTSRKQVRWIIRWESVITAIIGAVLGLALGVIFAVMITAALSSQGIEFVLPVVNLLIWVALAIVFGVVAAAFPARRAARLDVLQAVSYE